MQRIKEITEQIPNDDVKKVNSFRYILSDEQVITIVPLGQEPTPDAEFKTVFRFTENSDSAF